MARIPEPWNYTDAVNSLAEDLNSESKTMIGSPRDGVYKLAFDLTMEELKETVEKLVRVGIVPKAVVAYNEFASAIGAEIPLWDIKHLRKLFDQVESKLDPKRRKQFEDLVLAREPIPEELLEKILHKHERHGWPPQRIADSLNEHDVVTGMGKAWTSQKVTHAIRIVREKRDPRKSAHQQVA